MTYVKPENLGNTEDLYKAVPEDSWYLVDFLRQIFIESRSYSLFYPFCGIEDVGGKPSIFAELYPRNTMAEDMLRGHTAPFQKISVQRRDAKKAKVINPSLLIGLLNNKVENCRVLHNSIRGVDAPYINFVTIVRSEELITKLTIVDHDFNRVSPSAYFHSLRVMDNDHSMFLDRQRLISTDEWMFRSMSLKIESNLTNLDEHGMGYLLNRVKDFRFF